MPDVTESGIGHLATRIALHYAARSCINAADWLGNQPVSCARADGNVFRCSGFPEPLFIFAACVRARRRNQAKGIAPSNQGLKGRVLIRGGNQYLPQLLAGRHCGTDVGLSGRMRAERQRFAAPWPTGPPLNRVKG